MKTIEEKAFEYCKKEICPTCSDNKTCIKTNRIGDCIPTYMEYEAFIAGYKAAQEWISVDEIEQYGKYLVKDSDGDIYIAYLSDRHGEDQWYTDSECDIEFLCEGTITHWRPINND